MEEAQIIMKKKNDNFLERKPLRAEGIEWKKDSEGKITLEIQNKGFFNRLAQKLFKKPPVSYVHLDELGSFVWPLADGNLTIVEIGEMVESEFGEKAHPLYERLAKYFRILESYGFIKYAGDVK